MNTFELKSEFKPAGDQPKAIEALVDGLKKGAPAQTLLGVTGSGKTFTVANVIARINKPTLVIAHNKTLAAQLAQEYRDFFPNNAVHYFVSYYDYYQPEAYMPVTDTYIEKEAQINEEIDRLRHASTQALLTRRDVIVVASVSCIYNLGSPVEYEKVNLKISVGGAFSRKDFLRKLIDIFFERTNSDLAPGKFRALGNSMEIMPVSEEVLFRLEISGSHIESITRIDPVSRRILGKESSVFLFPAKHFVTDPKYLDTALSNIRVELTARLKELKAKGRDLEAQRLERRTKYDLALIKEVGYCNGIENYSRHFSGKATGEPPDSLLAYFPRTKGGSPDFLTIIDESHVTIPQIGGMHAGDASRKESLVEHGFRLPSAKDNRPLTFKEFEARIGQAIFTSATPSDYEREHSTHIVEQVIRPTGLIDPKLSIRPISEKGLSGGEYPGQIMDFLAEAEKTIERGGRAIATTLTKKMAEDLSEYLKERKISAEYLHSGIKTIERIEILTRFRKGSKGGGFDCIVGVNLLREGLDLPEVSLIGILDADKEGFLRSETSLIQIIGRAARNTKGHVILYADTVTGSIKRAVAETRRRRALQIAYNTEHGITPKTIQKKIHDITDQMHTEHQKAVAVELSLDKKLFAKNPGKLLKEKERLMGQAVKELDFETAAILRDEIKILTGENKPRVPRKRR
ncbi:MAG: excinuclease ABC subunit UvrB [Patescibacteria group bacterium]